MPEILTRRSKRSFVVLGVVTAGLLMLAVLFVFDPARSAIYPVCLFHQFTGLHCPGCGSLRALHHLTHGELAAAFHSNPLLLVALFGLGLTLVRRQFGPPRERFGASVFARPATAWVIGAVVILFTVLRNVPAPAFAWMSP